MTNRIARLFGSLAVLLALALPAAAKQKSPPDLGMDAATAATLTEQLGEIYGIDQAQAECLLGEIMNENRRNNDFTTSFVIVAPVVDGQCGLALE